METPRLRSIEPDPAYDWTARIAYAQPQNDEWILTALDAFFRVLAAIAFIAAVGLIIYLQMPSVNA